MELNLFGVIFLKGKKMATNSIRELQNRQFEDRLNTLKEGFASMERLNVRSLPEIMFKTYFLPLFCGESTENADELISQWFNIAGTNYSAVNIVDNNGNFIIRIPPLHDRNTMRPILNRNEDIAYAFSVAREKASLSPALANNIITNELDARYNSIANQEYSDLKEEWDKVFKHYGKTPNGSEDKNLSSTGDVDEFEF